MRTYSHTLLTYSAARYLKPNDGPFAALAALGATLPDLPAGIGAAWLRGRRLYSRETFLREVCGRSAFRKPDAALHSILPATVALAISAMLKVAKYDRLAAAFPLLLGWAAHVAADALTHGSDARPLFWPISNWRFESPVSYRERDRHALQFTLAEHTLILAATLHLLAKHKN